MPAAEQRERQAALTDFTGDDRTVNPSGLRRRADERQAQNAENICLHRAGKEVKERVQEYGYAELYKYRRESVVQRHDDRTCQNVAEKTEAERNGTRQLTDEVERVYKGK